MKIKEIKAGEILDSRGFPTLKVSLRIDKGVFSFSLPSGASRGKMEALELRDEDKKRFKGRGVLKAKEKVEKVIAPSLLGKDVRNQEEIDKIMIDLDGTENKSSLGANSILGVSVANLKAAASFSGKETFSYIEEISGFKKNFPRPLFNVINGGSHAKGGLDFQEFMIAPDEGSFEENLRVASEAYHRLKERLESINPLYCNIGDEGGFVPGLEKPEEALSLLKEVAPFEVVIDVAATEFFKDGKYVTKMGEMKREEIISYYKDLVKNFSILGLEDPLEEEDFKGWSLLREEVDRMIIGDDLLVTNPERIKRALVEKSCNAMILKVNQIGTVTESLKAAQMAKENNWKIIVSHRSGETEDDFISDFALGIGAQFIKSGAPARGERVIKYNRLWEIERGI